MAETPSDLKTEIFMVFGKDPEMNTIILEYLISLGIVLVSNKDDKNNFVSISQKLISLKHIRQAIVILSPDELCYEKGKKPAESFFITRQQTVFDLGLLIGKLGRENVICLHYDQKSFKLPCEYFNAFFIPFYPKNNNWQKPLLAKLKEFNLSLKI